MEYALKYDACEYRRREPEQDLLHQMLAEHLETFLDRATAEEFGLPRYVENELCDYMKCGVPTHGFVRVRCNKCGKSMEVEFSCKGRGFHRAHYSLAWAGHALEYG